MIERMMQRGTAFVRRGCWLAVSASVVAFGAQSTFAAPIEVKTSPPSTGAEAWKLMRDDSLPERQKDGQVVCSRYALEIENPGADTLECIASLVPPAPDAPPQRAAVLTAKDNRVIFSEVATIAQGVPDVKVECRRRQAPPPLLTPASCKPTATKVGQISDYYPAASRQLGEEGPVDLEYTLAESNATPTDIKVIGSSLSARLDEAATRFLGDAMFTTPCPGTRYRLRVRFKLQ